MRKWISPTQQKGFTLIELMIGLLLALVSMALLAQILSSVTTARKTTNSGNDVESSGAISAYLIERDLKQAGYGINIAPFIGCPTRVFDHLSNGGAGRTFDLLGGLYPVVIVAGATAKDSDRLYVRYSNNEGSHTPAKITSPYLSGSANVVVDNRFGFHAPVNAAIPGDLVLFGDSAGANCSIQQVDDLSGLTNVVFGSGSMGVGRFNKTGGFGYTYTSGDSLISLGNLMVDHQYTTTTLNTAGTITPGKLMLYDAFSPTSQAAPSAPSTLADGVYLLKAYYLKDADGDGTVDTVDQVAPTVATWNQILGVKFALVSRSKTKDNQSHPKSTLTLLDAQTFGGFNAPAISINLSTEESTYSYKVFSVTVPLRNRVWNGA